MRRFFRKFTFVPVVVILAGFVLFTFVISKPVREAEKHGVVHGTIVPAGALRADGPFVRYVALEPGRPGEPIPPFAVDDKQPGDDGSFELDADAADGTEFYLLGRIESAKIERWCLTVPLPRMRRTDERGWVNAATGKRLEPVKLSVDKTSRCD